MQNVLSINNLSLLSSLFNMYIKKHHDFLVANTVKPVTKNLTSKCNTCNIKYLSI